MRIDNIRIGRACNSSSTHSILIADPGHQITDNWSGTGEFGWDNFTLSSPRAKERYLSNMVYGQLRTSFGDKVADLLMAEMLDLNTPDPDDYIDHQSVMKFPYEFNTDRIDAQFLKEFTDFIRWDEVVILGGNDNHGTHALKSSKAVSTNNYSADGNIHCRKDEATGTWTFFDRYSGFKMRFALGSHDEPATAKLGAPELVDVKITDYCPYGCSYCYMGSTKAGEHADLRYLLKVAKTLGRHKVFEVAFGGGEPTLHPDISYILETFRENGMSAGLTTKNYHWAIEHNDEYDAIAFSVDSRAGVKSLLQVRENAGANSPTPVAHVVDGVMPWVETLDVILSLIQERISVTILGMKRTGRGAEFERQYEPRKELAEIATENGFLVRVDTAFIAEYQNEIDALGVSPKTYTKNEGESSCYIDAVSQAMARSSYDDGTPNPLDMGWNEEESDAALLDAWSRL